MIVDLARFYLASAHPETRKSLSCVEEPAFSAGTGEGMGGGDKTHGAKRIATIDLTTDT